MTSSDIIEEVLYASHSLGIKNEVMGHAKTILSADPKIARDDAYIQAFNKLSKGWSIRSCS
jgi:hypothetical protein